MAVRGLAAWLDNWLKYADVVFAVVVIVIISMMIIPLPSALLSFLLVVNLITSLVILLTTLYAGEPLQFSIFPSLLLITTLFRLALNVSSTRLILLTGEPGDVIRGFGDFVVGGSPVVGFIVFVILVVIQFIVITRGAERVAEVAARFTLDAMPGKQMAIDADLNAGLITEVEARARRRSIQREADFYGAMDGASKFVKGDAIAGIIIVVVNLIGGFIMGWMRGLDPAQSLQTYSLLTVGEGLVTQIPALLISTATGIVVTRAASDTGLGREMIAQVLAQPRVLLIAGGVSVVVALVPGMPHIPFFVVGILFAALGYLTQLGAKAKAEAQAQAAAATAEAGDRKPENVMSLLPIDPMEIELGYALLPLADPAQGGDLMERVVAIRRQVALEMGLVLPYIRVRDNIQLKPTQYVVKLRGVQVAEGEIYPDHYLAMNPGTVTDQVPGIDTREPAFGLPARWVSKAQKERAELAGYTVVDPPAVVATHLTEIIRTHAHDLLGRQEVQALMDAARTSHPAVVEELLPNLLTLGEVQKVLQNLLREGISIRDLVSILESLADHARSTRDIDLLTEFCRQALSRAIAQHYGLHGGQVKVITLHPDLEHRLAAGLERRETGAYVNLEPELLQKVLASLTAQANRAAALGHTPIVLTSPGVRFHFKRLTERTMPRLIVLSYNELLPDVEVEAIGMVSVA